MSSLLRSVGSIAAGALLLVATGCGGSDDAAPEPYVLTDLDGGTAPVPTDATSVTVPSETTPTSSDPTETGPTPDELIAAVGAATGPTPTFHVTVGTVAAPTLLAADYRYDAEGDDLVANVAQDTGDLVVRRLRDALYVDDGDGFEQIDPSEVDPDPSLSLVSFLVGWKPLADLRDTLLAADDLPVDGPARIDGVPVTSYSFTVDSADLAALPTVDSTSSTTDVVFSVDADDLPVRVDYTVGGVLVRYDYSAWGEPIDAEVPDVG